MIITSELRTLFENFYNQHQPDITAIFLCGSGSSPYIKNPHDLDFIILWSTADARRANIKDIMILQKEVKNINPSYAVMNRYVGYFITMYEQQTYPLYIYIHRTLQFVCGECDWLRNIDILPAQDYMLNQIKKHIIKAHNQKWFYHILIDLYIFENQSYNLTTEQQQNVQIVHDQSDPEKTEELYQWALIKFNIEKDPN